MRMPWVWGPIPSVLGHSQMSPKSRAHSDATVTCGQRMATWSFPYLSDPTAHLLLQETSLSPRGHKEHVL